MADSAKFDHDHLGHLLSDVLLVIPHFQRRYSWQENHVNEFWEDITRARLEGNSYFMGTVVLANSDDGNNRKLVIDGQQRITTTAVLFVAIRDRLRELNQERAAQSVESVHLSDYVLAEERSISKLALSPDDQSAYNALLAGDPQPIKSDLVSRAYGQLKGYVETLAPAEDDYRVLIDLTEYLDRRVQVLLAVATGLPEAYVIFETLNDRGADLTTADLLKNFLFSEARQDGISYAQAAWTRMSAAFDKPEDFVKFLRHEYMSRKGHVTNRGLYKALQRDITGSPKTVRRYLENAEMALLRFKALKEPDDASWSSQAVEVKDSLLALRRFRFETNTPLLLAAFATWKHTEATRFVEAVTAWSVRAWVAGTIGGGVAEKAFCDAAVAVATGNAKTTADVLPYMKDLVPDDASFRQAFLGLGPVDTTRAKYLLARLERQFWIESAKTPEGMPDWSSKAVSVEHIFARSSKRDRFSSDDEFEEFTIIKDRLPNLTLLERTLNSGLEDKLFADKRETYGESSFELTKLLADIDEWGFAQSTSRGGDLASLAVKAWAASTTTSMRSPTAGS